MKNMNIREAVVTDLPEIVNLFYDDALGVNREDISIPISENYMIAFSEIQKEQNNKIFVIEVQGEIIGVMQLIIIPHLNRLGSK